MEGENKEIKRTSKLTSLIESETEPFNNLQITVYYSENNWKTCEEINLIVDENTTINQLIDSSIYKFKTELFYDNIDKKQFKIMLFKKKKKIPNDEYPICNPESKVKDYGKIHFCLVEDINTKKEKNEEEPKSESNNKILDNYENNDLNNNVNKNINIQTKGKEKENENIKHNKTCRNNCFYCQIY